MINRNKIFNFVIVIFKNIMFNLYLNKFEKLQVHVTFYKINFK